MGGGSATVVVGMVRVMNKGLVVLGRFCGGKGLVMVVDFGGGKGSNIGNLVVLRRNVVWEDDWAWPSSMVEIEDPVALVMTLVKEPTAMEASDGSTGGWVFASPALMESVSSTSCRRRRLRRVGGGGGVFVRLAFAN
ncbi:hypothetical protein L6452_08556 [Arctium lappa]|uniref:Uncharacterized protein n=1 Tax=Arctium lappa TaxID=4217 RepID=A0ACB9DHM4_ARCLA|nr:hypothetical protein L6452_08556 [Arctium lappa]